jgi:hypothetical protein
MLTAGNNVEGPGEGGSDEDGVLVGGSCRDMREVDLVDFMLKMRKRSLRTCVTVTWPGEVEPAKY